MKRTDRPKTGSTTYHRDRTVTVWDCLTESWVRGVPGDSLLATLGAEERERAMRHCGVSA